MARCTPSTRNNGSENRAHSAHEPHSPTHPPPVSRPGQVARTHQEVPAPAGRNHYTPTDQQQGACKIFPQAAANGLGLGSCREQDLH